MSPDVSGRRRLTGSSDLHRRGTARRARRSAWHHAKFQHNQYGVRWLATAFPARGLPRGAFCFFLCLCLCFLCVLCASAVNVLPCLRLCLFLFPANPPRASFPTLRYSLQMKFRCPICKKPTDSSASPEFPFCSERCKLLDLGNWSSEKYVISEPANDDTLFEDVRRDSPEEHEN
jgi:endogenous inhibitor of DNA gyrase (YacG/DUF329 family)